MPGCITEEPAMLLHLLKDGLGGSSCNTGARVLLNNVSQDS
jgi:hypothetical protein